ncbi:restriction endonuclease subunit S [Orbaceae bacterium ac157xtp]
MNNNIKINHFIDKLLKDMPVEWKTLGEVVIDNFWVMPQTPKFIENDGIPYITSKNIHGGNIYFEKIKFISHSDYLNLSKTRPILAGDILISMIGTIGEIALVKETDLDFYGQNMYLIRLNQSFIRSDYFLHFFDSPQIKRYFNSVKNNSGQGYLKADVIEKLEIPIPPLPVQAEIVRVLDTFTALTAELTTELTAEFNARKKQYNHYRDNLLTFKENEIEWKTLGEVAEKIYSGGTPKTEIAEYWEKGTIPWMSSGEVNLGTVYKTEKFITEVGLKNSSAKFVPKNSIVIALAGQGKTRGKVARIRIDLTTNQSLASLTFNKNKVNPDYIFHFLSTQYENLRQISSGNGTRGGLNLQMISSYKIPIPPLDEQNRIVEILDKFDTLTNSITEGLPREIELRRKQYEYYRELLLSFPKETA